MISKETIHEIFTIANIEEVIGNFIQLKKSGNNYKGFSPFSNENTPSFIVSPKKQIWKDFSSGKGGNIISFLIEHEHFTYPEAIYWLANKYNIKIQEDNKYSLERNIIIKKKESIYIIQNFAKYFFIEQLYNTNEGLIIGMKYLKKRSFKDSVIQKFELGYAPNNYKTFTNLAIQIGFEIKYLEKSGLTVINNNKKFDRFYGRIVFPIHSLSGRILGFAGRSIKIKNNTAKYLNSSESNVYHKNKILYGIYQAKHTILKENLCYLVEGYTDVISLYQNGIKNVVASSGTALTSEQIQLIKRFTFNITLLYDGDIAGIKASLRGIDLILEQGMNVRIILFPNGEDPDSFSQKYSRDKLVEFIQNNHQDFIHFKINFLLKKMENDSIKKSCLIQNIVESISKISNNILREIYIQKTVHLLNINENIIYRELYNIDLDKQKQIGENTKKKITKILENNIDIVNPIFILEEAIIQLIIEYGDKNVILKNYTSSKKEEYQTTVIEEILLQFETDQLSFSLDTHQKIYIKVREGFKKGEFRTSNFFLKLFDEQINKTISSLLTERHYLAKWNKKKIYVTLKEDKLNEYLTEVLLRYKSHYISNLIKDLIDKIKNNGLLKDDYKIQEKIIRLTNLKIQINKKLHRYV